MQRQRHHQMETAALEPAAVDALPANWVAAREKKHLRQANPQAAFRELM